MDNAVKYFSPDLKKLLKDMQIFDQVNERSSARPYEYLSDY